MNCPLYSAIYDNDDFYGAPKKNCGTCVYFKVGQCSERSRLSMWWSSEAHKIGLVPPENLTPEELDEFRKSVDADKMGFDGVEGYED